MLRCLVCNAIQLANHSAPRNKYCVSMNSACESRLVLLRLRLSEQYQRYWLRFFEVALGLLVMLW